MTIRDLKVYQIGLQLLVDLERLTNYLPKTELREIDQLKRAAKSILANIAEGYGKRRYKKEFLKYLTNALGSSDEVQVHLDILSVSCHLNQDLYENLQKRYRNLSVRILNLIGAVKYNY